MCYVSKYKGFPNFKPRYKLFFKIQGNPSAIAKHVKLLLSLKFKTFSNWLVETAYIFLIFLIIDEMLNARKQGRIQKAFESILT